MTGFACTIPVGGKHIYEPSIQMRNRGNGKGGGIAACGLVPEEMGVSRRVLEEGVASVEEINKAMRFGFNWPAGPLEMAAGARKGWQ